LGQREKGMLLPASILTGLGLLFMLSKTGIMRYWPIILIIVGIVLIVRYQMKPKQGDNDIIEK
jgi:membrane-bound ClpP family serine protease